MLLLIVRVLYCECVCMYICYNYGGFYLCATRAVAPKKIEPRVRWLRVFVSFVCALHRCVYSGVDNVWWYICNQSRTEPRKPQDKPPHLCVFPSVSSLY